MMIFVAKPALAQSATDSGTATDSATASDSATATESASEVSTGSSTPTVLPQSGAHDVLIIFSAGLIFVFAGVTVLSGTKQVFNDFE